MGGVIRRGDVWWADLAAPTASESGFRRPVVVVQSDAFNDSAGRTVVVVPLTSNLNHAGRPGTVLVESAASGLPRDSVARSDQIHTVSREEFVARAGRLAPAALEQVLAALDLVLGR